MIAALSTQEIQLWKNSTEISTVKSFLLKYPIIWLLKLNKIVIIAQYYLFIEKVASSLYRLTATYRSHATLHKESINGKIPVEQLNLSDIAADLLHNTRFVEV